TLPARADSTPRSRKRLLARLGRSLKRRTEPLHPVRPRGRLTRHLVNGHDAVHVDVVQYLLDAAGPANLDLLDVPVRSQSEMHATIAGRRISDSSGYLVPLRLSILS